jgi:hypothetical protein
MAVLLPPGQTHGRLHIPLKGGDARTGAHPGMEWLRTIAMPLESTSMHCCWQSADGVLDRGNGSLCGGGDGTVLVSGCVWVVVAG